MAIFMYLYSLWVDALFHCSFEQIVAECQFATLLKYHSWLRMCIKLMYFGDIETITRAFLEYLLSSV